MTGLLWVGLLALGLAVGGAIFARFHLARLDRRIAERMERAPSSRAT